MSTGIITTIGTSTVMMAVAFTITSAMAVTSTLANGGLTHTTWFHASLDQNLGPYPFLPCLKHGARSFVDGIW